MNNIIILGGGFGGIYAYKHIRDIYRTNDISITLIDRYEYFLFTPLLHEYANDVLPKDVLVTYFDTVIQKHDKFINDNVIAVDSTDNKVICKKSSYEYDLLIYALGADSKSIIPGNIYYLKTIEDADKLRNIFKSINKDSITNVNIIGAGATGIELAFELQDYINSNQLKNTTISLFSGTGTLGTDMNKNTKSFILKKLNNKKIQFLSNTIIVKEENGFIYDSSGHKYASDISINTIGISPNSSIYEEGGKSDTKRIEINEYLQSINNENIFSLGDVAGDYPQDAQTAVNQAKVCANNAIRFLKNEKLVKYKHKSKGNLISLGQRDAIGEINGKTISGSLVWFLWRTVYIFKMVKFRESLKTAKYYTKALLNI